MLFKRIMSGQEDTIFVIYNFNREEGGGRGAGSFTNLNKNRLFVNQFNQYLIPFRFMR